MNLSKYDVFGQLICFVLLSIFKFKKGRIGLFKEKIVLDSCYYTINSRAFSRGILGFFVTKLERRDGTKNSIVCI